MRKALLPLALLALAMLACTLTETTAAGNLGEVQPSPTPTGRQATATPPAQPALPVRAGATQTALPTATPQALRCEVNTAALNVRAGPGLDYPAVDWLTVGQTVTITQPGPAWLEVDTGELTGFVKSEYCEVRP